MNDYEEFEDDLGTPTEKDLEDCYGSKSCLQRISAAARREPASPKSARRPCSSATASRRGPSS